MSYHNITDIKKTLFKYKMIKSIHYLNNMNFKRAIWRYDCEVISFNILKRWKKKTMKFTVNCINHKTNCNSTRNKIRCYFFFLLIAIARNECLCIRVSKHFEYVCLCMNVWNYENAFSFFFYLRFFFHVNERKIKFKNEIEKRIYGKINK